MILPPIPDPVRYTGLYVYDFGTHVSVGYTAMEVRMLRESEAHRGGTAYEIYRIGAEGAVELRGVLDERLTAQEAMCFLYKNGAAARGDYEKLRNAAARSALPCVAELVLARLYDFEPPDVVAMLYPAAASGAIAGWLRSVGFAGGDSATAGTDAHRQVTTGNGFRIDAADLPTALDYNDRSYAEVMDSVSEALQR